MNMEIEHTSEDSSSLEYLKSKFTRIYHIEEEDNNPLHIKLVRKLSLLSDTKSEAYSYEHSHPKKI